MALPQDGQNANGLTKVTEVPTGKELIFVDPTTNEGGIITLEDLTTQILNKLTSKIFTLDQGNITLIEALNKLNSNIANKLGKDQLTTAVNDALTQAKESGEFDGKDGKTPARGTDYWTEADKAAIVDDVIAALPAAEEVSV